MTNTIWVAFAILSVAVRCVAENANHAAACPQRAWTKSPTIEELWSLTASTRPRKSTAPLPHDITPPLGLPGICTKSVFTSASFAMPAQVDSAQVGWSARPRADSQSTQAVYGNEHALQLAEVRVSVDPSMALQLLYQQSSADVLANPLLLTIPVVNQTGQGPVHGVRLREFMCQVDRTSCDKARAEIHFAVPTTTAQPPQSHHVTESTVGSGLCTGQGVGAMNKGVPVSLFRDACRRQCAQMIENNFNDPASPSCKGYAFNVDETLCVTYGGWPVTAADGTAGYTCINVAVHIPKPPPPERRVVSALLLPTPPEKVELDLTTIFQDMNDDAPLTATRTIVHPVTRDCFTTFERVRVEDRPIYVSNDDWRVINKMMEISGSTNRSVEQDEENGARFVDITVERICLRTCSGDLAGICKERDKHAFRRAFAKLQHDFDPNFTPTSDTHAAPHKKTAVKVHHHYDPLGDPHCYVWVIALCFLTFLASLCFSWVLLVVVRRARTPPPVFATVEAMSLKYDYPHGVQELSVYATNPAAHLGTYNAVQGAQGATMRPPSRAGGTGL
eukprot:TRINITY_DN70460_c0_g1_i1.p1 TRINITY_DN70460_c0_g1~~TRINITY_DN70460_c0_g1_i1.p1  ORF type:complete len:561 (-),score=52.73 TRINITY_DN70460_c0_g1_i1:165-1847(-)